MVLVCEIFIHTLSIFNNVIFGVTWYCYCLFEFFGAGWFCANGPCGISSSKFPFSLFLSITISTLWLASIKDYQYLNIWKIYNHVKKRTKTINQFIYQIITSINEILRWHAWLHTTDEDKMEKSKRGFPLVEHNILTVISVATRCRRPLALRFQLPNLFLFT